MDKNTRYWHLYYKCKKFNATKSHAKRRSMKDGQGNVQIIARMETLHNTPNSKIYVWVVKDYKHLLRVMEYNHRLPVIYIYIWVINKLDQFFQVNAFFS
jgi:hypothetical protein